MIIEYRGDYEQAYFYKMGWDLVGINIFSIPLHLHYVIK